MSETSAPFTGSAVEKKTQNAPEFLSPNELQLLPKLSRRALGSIVLMSFSMRVRTLSLSARKTVGELCGSFTHSSLMVSSSEVGSKGSTKEKSDVERSLRKRRCKTPGCMLEDGTVEEDREGMIAQRLKEIEESSVSPSDRVSSDEVREGSRRRGTLEVWRDG